MMENIIMTEKSELDKMTPKEIIAIPDNFTGYIDIVYDKMEIRYQFQDNKLVNLSYS